MFFVIRRSKLIIAILATLFIVAPPALADTKSESQTETIKTLYSIPITFEMVKVPGGKFSYSPDGKTPAKEIEIKPFWIGKTECLWEHFDVFESRLDLTEEQKIEIKKNGIDAKT